MDKQTPQSFFNQILSDSTQSITINQRLLSKIQQDIATFQSSNSPESLFLPQCLEYLCEQSLSSPADEQKAFKIIVYLQPAIIEKFQALPAEVQDLLRSGILNVIISRSKNIRMMGTLGMLVRGILELDFRVGGFKEWVEPLGEVIKWMASEEPGVAQAGVEFFIFLFKQTNFTSSNSDIPLHKLANTLLQTLFQLFTSAPQQQKQQQHSTKITLREKILFLVLQTIKSFSSFDGNNDAIVKQCLGDSVELWTSLFSSILKSAVRAHLGIKKYVVKILIVIYRDMATFCQARLKNQNTQAQLFTAWQFTYKFLPYYLQSQIFKKSGHTQAAPIPYFDQDYDISYEPVQALTHNILQLLSVFACSGMFNLTIKLSIFHIVNILFHYYIISNFELRTWDCNYLYFVTVPEYESIRGKILNILNDIIQKNGDIAIQAILLISEKFLMNYRQANTTETVNKIIQSMNIKQVLESGRVELNLKVQDILRFTTLSGCDIKQSLNVRGETWRKSQVALSILGRFSQDIIVFQSKQQGAFDIENFVKGLLKQFEIEDNDVSIFLLKGQSLYCLTRFTEIISIRYKQFFTDLVASCCVCVLENYPVAVRIAACKSLTIFFRKIQKHKLKLTPQQQKTFQTHNILQSIMTLQLTPQTNNYALQSLTQLLKTLGPQSLNQQITPLYILDNIHKNISHPNTLKLCFNLFELICSAESSYEKAVMTIDENSSEPIVTHFVVDCLETYMNIVKSQQKKFLKSLDVDLISTVLKFANIVIQKCPKNLTTAQNQIVLFTPFLTQIIKHNQNLQIHVASTICLKNIIKLCPQLLKQHQFQKNIIEAIHSLLKVPADKTFQGASVYVGNLILLTFQYLIDKPDQEILQEVVLKIFKSRTPSVIQSLVLVYSRMINWKTEKSDPFGKGEWETKLKNITDFLASFSIQNRMGLKILVDKWLLQQSLFRGTYTKISTFMALSKMFLLRDKRIDNLLVIGFNPSHTNINNDVNAPLKILATLIRCLHNEMGGKDQQNQQPQQQAQTFELKDQPSAQKQKQKSSIDVGLQKFKQTSQQIAAKSQAVGGLADREGQQGSTCYMSAMLEFYDDGEQCDETTEEDLIVLGDSSTKFTLSEYLTDFFLYLTNSDSVHHQYFIECLRHLLKEDLKTLQKYVKVVV